jgi:hypothetical protein
MLQVLQNFVFETTHSIFLGFRHVRFSKACLGEQDSEMYCFITFGAPLQKCKAQGGSTLVVLLARWTENTHIRHTCLRVLVCHRAEALFKVVLISFHCFTL